MNEKDPVKLRPDGKLEIDGAAEDVGAALLALVKELTAGKDVAVPMRWHVWRFSRPCRRWSAAKDDKFLAAMLETRRIFQPCALTTGEGSTMKRKGLVLAYMLKFKQICDHPALYLGTDAYRPEDSGKFLVLGERAAEVAERQEKMLVAGPCRRALRRRRREARHRNDRRRAHGLRPPRRYAGFDIMTAS